MPRWTIQPPTSEGWYWIKYKRGNRCIVSPCHVVIFQYKTQPNKVWVRTFGNQESWMGRPGVGFPGVTFGQRIEEPNA